MTRPGSLSRDARSLVDGDTATASARERREAIEDASTIENDIVVAFDSARDARTRARDGESA